HHQAAVRQGRGQPVPQAGHEAGPFPQVQEGEGDPGRQLPLPDEEVGGQGRAVLEAGLNRLRESAGVPRAKGGRRGDGGAEFVEGAIDGGGAGEAGEGGGGSAAFGGAEAEGGSGGGEGWGSAEVVGGGWGEGAAADRGGGEEG